VVVDIVVVLNLIPRETRVVNTVIQLVLLLLAVVCVGIPLVAVAAVYRDELADLRDRVLRPSFRTTRR
jgi:hypothetical protein